MVQILPLLAKTIGPMLAKVVMDKLLASKGAPSKMQGVQEAIEKGVSIVSALRGEFGDEFLSAITDAIGSKITHGWTFEAGSADYIKLNSAGSGQETLATLRDELNINLDRLTLIGKIPDEEQLNYFRGALSTWRRRYAENIGIDEDAKEIFAAMDDLLDGTNLTFKDALETISKTSLGGVGALLVICGVLLATSTGVGVATLISTFLFGIPWLSVGALVIPGVILVALSQFKFSNKNAMSTCVKMAYKLLEEHATTA